jgi:hypothetical protein
MQLTQNEPTRFNPLICPAGVAGIRSERTVGDKFDPDFVAFEFCGAQLARTGAGA